MLFVSALLLAAQLAHALYVPGDDFDPDNNDTRASDACSVVHVFLAKGNNEPYPGRQGALVNSICNGSFDGLCTYENIKWWNYLNYPYCDGISQGVANGTQQIIDYNKKCPDTKLVVGGYSQGSHVVTDILGGGGERGFYQDCKTPHTYGLDLDSAAAKQIVAALVFGNTRHTASQQGNMLSGTPYDGTFPRNDTTQLCKLRQYNFADYCVNDDPVCNSASPVLPKVVEHHLNYYDVDTEEASNWVKQMIAAGPAKKFASACTDPNAVAPPVVTSPAAPYPTVTAHRNSTVTVECSVIPIPPASTSVQVTVYGNVPSSEVASYTSKFPGGVPTTVAVGVPAKPTSTGVAGNGTVPVTVPVTGGAQGMLAAPLALGLAIAGASMLLI